MKSTWDLIRGHQTDRDAQKLRYMVKDVVDMLKDGKKISPHMGNIFSVDFHRFLKSLEQKGTMDPEEVFIFIMRDMTLAEHILHKRYDELMSALRQLSTQDTDRELLYITTFYDAYYETKSFFRAALRAAHSPFSKIDGVFVYNIFQKHKYLRDPEHLAIICELLDEVGFAYNLTKGGIKEDYRWH